jgi:hypothetical protein
MMSQENPLMMEEQEDNHVARAWVGVVNEPPYLFAALSLSK